MKWDLLSLIGMLQNLASGIVSGIGVPGSSPSNFVSPLRAPGNVIIHFPDRLRPTLVNTQELSGGCPHSPHWGARVSSWVKMNHSPGYNACCG